MNPFRVCMVVLLSVWLPGSGMASEKTSFASLPVGVSRGAVILADFNGDGALDLFLSGLTAGATPMAKVYFFADQSVSDSLSFTGVVNSAAAVGDLDSDNDLDLLLTGMSQDSAVSRVYWMQDGLPADSTDLRGVFNSAAAVADLDNDGDLDLLLTGTCNADTAVSMIYRNQAGDFVLTPAPLPDVTRGAVAFADWDNDQDVDFLLTGWDEAQRKAIAWLYRNDNGHYEFERAVKGVFDSAVAWGDYNDDGLVDLVLTGDTSQGADIITVIYRNTGDGFLQKQKLQGAATGDIAAGDFDNDGDLDFIIAGDNGPGGIAEMYENDTGTFHLAEFGLLPVTHSALAVGDYDDDGTLDVVLAGESQAGSPVTVLYRNPSSDIDSAPHPPQNLTATNKRDAIKLRWQPANDDRTPAEALTYNLQIGSLPGGVDVLSPGADLDSGQRKIFQMGNAWQNSAWTVRGLEEGTYSWRVQAIDHGFKPSRFSPEQHFLIDRTPPARPTLLEAIVDSAQVTLIWSRTPAPDLWQYRIYVRPEAGDFALRDSTFGDTSITIRDLTNEVETSFIVTAVDVSRNESDASNEIQATPFAVPFSDGFVPFPPLVQGDAAWGDYDSDGDLDLILTGLNGTLPVTRIYRNDLDTERFVLVNEALPGVYDSSVAWGDYDNDDDLDLLIAGETSDGSFISHIYENRRENGPPTFVLTPDRLLPIRSGAVAWCDFDNDGDLDAIVCGEGRESEPATRLYRNMGQPGFAELTTSMPGFKESTLACGDYDNDGYQDVVIAGVTTPGVHTGLYKNVSAGGDSGEREFIDSGVPLSGVRRGAVPFGDVDNDGDLDILLSGLTRENEAVTEIFVNDNGFFRLSTAALDGVREASVAWGDYDNDGWSDILMAGLDNLGQPVTRLYRNLYGTAHEIQFARIRHTLPGISSGAVAWGDYDRNKDGVEDLDILVTGAGQSGGVSKIFRNNNRRKRSAPAVPGKLSARITFDAAELRWEAPDSTMNSYNVRIGVTAEGGEISSGMANPVDGFRKIPARGNVKGNTFLQVNGLENRTYHWTVQAIDPAFAGSAFAPENEFAICDSLIEKFEVVDSTDASLTLEVSLAVPAETIAIRYGSDKSRLTELPVHLTNTTGGLVTVPGLEQNTRYYFKLRVNDRTTFVDLCTLESARTRVRAWSEAFSGSDKVRTITTDDRYTLVGIPYEADANRMSLVFQREQYDKTKLRVFRVNKSADGYEELQADWQNETLKPGYSYLVSSRARLAIDAGVGNSVEDRPFVPVRVNHDPRVPGPVWFMMANPFSTDMPITQILDSDLLAQENVFRFDSGRRSDPWQIVEDGVVRAYGAYLICLKTGGDILIRNAPEGQRSEVKKRTQHDLWKVKLNLQDNAGRPHLLYAGSHEEASMSRDFYDILAPPPWNRSVDAYFLNDSLPGGYFIGDFRPPGQPYYGFRFFISAHGEGPFQLAIEPEGLPVNFDILLVDETNNVAVDPGQVFFHEIDNTFKMVVARQEEIAKQKQTLKVIPEHFQVHQNFPNPFNASTFISYDLPAYTRVSVAIYNVLGQKVRSLVSNQVQIGSQQVIWDGHDDSRMPVASGIYVVRIASEFGTLARKMSLLR